jgi:hypothetical protein
MYSPGLIERFRGYADYVHRETREMRKTARRAWRTAIGSMILATAAIVVVVLNVIGVL